MLGLRNLSTQCWPVWWRQAVSRFCCICLNVFGPVGRNRFKSAADTLRKDSMAFTQDFPLKLPVRPPSCIPWSTASSRYCPISLHTQTGGQGVLRWGMCPHSAWPAYNGGEQCSDTAVSAQMSSAQLIETALRVLLIHPKRTTWLSPRTSHWKYLWGPHMLLLHTLPMLNIALALQCSLSMTAIQQNEWLHYGTAQSGTRTLVWLLQIAACQQKDEHMSSPCQQVTSACMRMLWGWCLGENSGASIIGPKM